MHILSSEKKKKKHGYSCAFRMNKGNVSLYVVVELQGWQMSWVSSWGGGSG